MICSFIAIRQEKRFRDYTKSKYLGASIFFFFFFFLDSIIVRFGVQNPM